MLSYILLYLVVGWVALLCVWLMDVMLLFGICAVSLVVCVYAWLFVRLICLLFGRFF